MEIEGPHPSGEQQGPQLPQVVVPEIGLLPVQNIQFSRRPRGQLLFEPLIAGGIRLSFGRHLHSSYAFDFRDGPGHRISTRVPAVISSPPTTVLTVTASFSTTKASTMEMTTLNLSMGTTRLASPSWSAR